MMMVQHGHEQQQVQQVQVQKIGPLDARRRRSRCEGCARSHVKVRVCVLSVATLCLYPVWRIIYESRR